MTSVSLVDEKQYYNVHICSEQLEIVRCIFFSRILRWGKFVWQTSGKKSKQYNWLSTKCIITNIVFISCNHLLSVILLFYFFFCKTKVASSCFTYRAILDSTRVFVFCFFLKTWFKLRIDTSSNILWHLQK